MTDWKRVYSEAQRLAAEAEAEGMKASAAQESDGKPNDYFVMGWLKGALITAYNRALVAEGYLALDGAQALPPGFDQRFERVGPDYPVFRKRPG